MAMKSGGDDMILASYDTDNEDHHQQQNHLPPAVMESNSKIGGFEGSDLFDENYGISKIEEEKKENETNLRQRRVSKLENDIVENVEEKKQKPIIDKIVKSAFKQSKSLEDINPYKAGLYAFIELVLHCIFLIFITIIALSKVSSDLFHVNEGIINFFVSDAPEGMPAFEDITEHYQIWGWIENQFFDKIYWSQFPGNDINGNDKIIDGIHKLIGKPRFRMLRVQNNSCAPDYILGDSIVDCYDSYSKSNEDRETFGPEGISAFTYLDANILKASEHWTLFASYGGGGYIQEFPFGDREAAEEIIQILKANQWISRGTRVLFIDFTVYDFTHNLFTVVKLVFELPPTGQVVPSQKVLTVQLLQYFEPYDYFILVCEGVFCAFILLYSALELKELFKNRAWYLFDPWTCFDLLVIGMSYAAIIVSLKLELLVRNQLKALIRSQNYVHMQEFVDLYFFRNDLIGYVFVLAWFKILKHIQFNRRTTQFVEIIFLSMRKGVPFSLYIIVTYIGFGIFGYLHFGDQMPDYRTVDRAFVSIWRLTFGDFDYKSMKDAAPFWTAALFLVYTVTIIIYLLNIYFTLIALCYAEIDDAKIDYSRKYVLGDFVRETLNMLLRKLKLREIPKSIPENERLIDWEKKLKEFGYADDDIERSLLAFDIDKEEFITDEMQKCVEIDLMNMQKRKTPLQENERIEKRVIKFNSNLKKVLPKLKYYESSATFKSTEGWHLSADGKNK